MRVIMSFGGQKSLSVSLSLSSLSKPYAFTEGYMRSIHAELFVVRFADSRVGGFAGTSKAQKHWLHLTILQVW